MKTNYHTHTTRCHHAVGSDEDYVKSAIKAGYEEIGFSDHSPWLYRSNFRSPIRMLPEELPDYVTSIKTLKEKYKDKISIKLGLECEYYPTYMRWMIEQVKTYKIDYLVFGNHFHISDENRFYYGRDAIKPEHITMYVDDAIEGLKTGLFAYLAHPDLFMRGYPSFDETCERESRRLCEFMKEYNYPLEYNLAGLMNCLELHVNEYPHPAFWKIAAEVGCDAIIGVDAHDYRHLEDSTYRGMALENLHNLGINIVDKITFFKEEDERLK